MDEKVFRSDAFEAIHSAVAGMHQAGTVDNAVMRYFDETCISHTDIVHSDGAEDANV